MSETDGSARRFRIMPYAPGYGVVIWYGNVPYKDETPLHLSDEEFISLDEAIHAEANKIRARVISDWVARARPPSGEKP